MLAGARDRVPDPEAVAIRRSNCRVLCKALERLPGRDRDALLLTAVGGLKTSDAARVLGISESALKMRTLRARRKLSAIMEDEHGTGRRG
jgi:RNA polymerase sigma-70 factor (ECF subfamily)